MTARPYGARLLLRSTAGRGGFFGYPAPVSRQTAEPSSLVGAKKRDYWWTVLFTDPIALPAVRFLSRSRWLTPDQLSMLAVLFGLCVGPAFATGTRWGLITGAVLFQLAFIADCMDGKLARALGTGTARGEALDKIGDAFRRASASLGIIVYLWRTDDPRDDYAYVFGAIYVVAAYFFFELSGGSEIRQEAWFKKDATRESSDPTTSERGGLRGALARRRLMPTPGMPDVQATAFIIGPLTGFVVPALWVATAMLTAGIAINLWRLFR